MASPIHSYLFSPPSSPPVLPADHVLRSPALSSIRSLIPSNTLPRSSIDGTVKARSPLTQQSRFTLDSTYPAFPSKLRERKDVFTLTVEDTSLSASTSRPNSPRITEKILLGSPGHYLNVPTVTQPVPRGMPGLPKPVIRLLWLASLLITSMMLLVYVPGSRLPSLHAASVSRRLAMASDGRAYVDVLDPIKGWQDAKDRDYVPPQIFAGRLDRRVEAARVAPVVRVPTPHPKANRPSPRPLPRSHEILALQSYLLQSSYNVLPADLDTDAPLDANLVLGYAADEIALHELEAERAQDIVVWYGADGSSLHPHDLLTLLESVHGKDRHPTLIPLSTRPDFDKLLPILKRLDFPMQHGAVVMMGNRPYAADLTEMSAMKANGKLANLLASIGWGEKKAAPKKVWKPNQVKVKRREMTEVERALEVAKKARK